MHLTIYHKTTYFFDEPIQYALQQIRLTPKSRQGQKVLDWQIEIQGGKKELEFDDHHNNRVVLFSLDAGCEKIELRANGRVETSDTAGVTGRHGGFLPLWHFQKSTDLTSPGPGVRQLVKTVNKGSADDLDRLHALSAAITEKVAYQTGATDTETTAEQAFSAGAGVCQDHSHIFLSAARLMGYPARYVSGYLKLDDAVEQNASHAWAEVHVDGLGWVGFDISNGISPDERYAPIATGLDYRETAPVSGMRFGQGGESMIVSLQVQQ